MRHNKAINHLGRTSKPLQANAGPVFACRPGTIVDIWRTRFHRGGLLPHAPHGLTATERFFVAGPHLETIWMERQRLETEIVPEGIEDGRNLDLAQLRPGNWVEGPDGTVILIGCPHTVTRGIPDLTLYELQTKPHV